MTRSGLPVTVWAGGALLAGAIAAWDIWTHGQLLVAVVMIVAAILFAVSAFGRGHRSRVHGRPLSLGTRSKHQRVSDASLALLARAASAVGVKSAQSLMLRSAVGVASVTLVERFVLYPSAGLVFDLLIAVALLAIVLLLANFAVRSRFD